MSDVGRRRDVDRAAVAEAEIAAFDGTDVERIRPTDELAQIVDDVTTGEWWRSCAETIAARGVDGRAIGAVSVVASRSDARSSVAVEAVGRVPQIRLAAPQATLATVAHELAHVLAGHVEVHGPVFRRAYLDTVGTVTNPSSGERRGRLHVEQLDRAFRVLRLDVGERRWPTPPSATEALAPGAIAL